MEASNAQLAGKRETLAGTETKLKIAEDGRLKEIVAIQSRIASEKTIQVAVEQVIQTYKTGISLSIFEHDFDHFLKSAGEVTADEVSKVTLQAIRSTIDATNVTLKDFATQINTALKAKAFEAERFCTELKANHSRMSKEIATKITDLKAKGLAGGIAELDQLLKQKGDLGREITGIEQHATALKTCQDQRKTLRIQLATVRTEMTARRKVQLKHINENLDLTLQDYKVFIRYDDAGITDDFFDFIQHKLTGTYIQDQTCFQVCGGMTPSDLADWILQNDAAKIAASATISPDKAQQIIDKLRYWHIIFDLQSLAKPPKPIITVKTKGVNPKEIPVIQLSDGQRHTILLTVAMLAETNVPLVIDQPEDDLDNAFISSSIVGTLRAIKERRQVILVTHNANIAVLGDSELLLPMHREDDCGKAVERGSIDRLATRECVLEILEGGTDAFSRRQRIYGH